MARRFSHRQGFSIGDPGVWVSGEFVHLGRVVSVNTFVPDDDYAALGSARRVDAYCRNAAVAEARAIGELPASPRGLGMRPRAVAALALLVILTTCAFWAGAAWKNAEIAAIASSRGTPVDWTREFWVDWCQNPWSGSVEEQAMAFLRAQAEGSDVAACKAAIWLTEPGLIQSMSTRMVAARNYLDSLGSDAVVTAVRRDASRFGVDPDSILGMLKEAGAK